MSEQLPAHVSPVLEPVEYPFAQTISDLRHENPPPALISPAFTPPATPGTGTPAISREAESIPVDTSNEEPQRLLEALPEVNCVVRARIPTTTGTEMFLHLYQNNVDNKEHLAIVFGSQIRSQSLDAPRPGETEMDRMIRGAYTGRLYPGRTSSRLEPQSGPSQQQKLKSVVDQIGHSSPVPSAVPRQPPSKITSAPSSSPLSSNNPTPTSSAATAPPASINSPLVRIHSECYTGETAWSARCDCGEQLDEAARLMALPSASSSGGVIIYLRQEGRGIGLGEKLKAYNLQDLGSDTVEANLILRHPADARSYGLATAMLVDLGLGGDTGIRLLTNNPDKIRAVEGPNREVTVKERVAMVPLAWRSHGKQGFNSPEVGGYLRTKIEKMGHMLQMSEGF
ncbi:hypothetical protein L228DRAFT_263207 [Xylona heveae TC161]|uniref:GTP cyclohydrolase II n=1 Tax=Xylona heveae (strain CBS 132557 / TC161) TaxID=1328760 RepID=A0A165A2H5_XYLHT|nr:hypothetical protein L228DRAFT_263207 [Xylona heveae TC161]KZF19863.1 hypothetical protein L228DRAFT_263207 [Xylona heveae TC161]